MARIVDAIGRRRSGALSCFEAAEVLGVGERHFRRLRDRCETAGAEGLLDRRRGRVSGRRVPVDRIEWVLGQYRTCGFDFTAKHFHERLVAEHGFELGYTWTKRVPQTAGLVRRAPKRFAHRKKRPRRPRPGMLPFQDGSRHEWLVGQPPLDLITTAVGRPVVIARHGLFCSLDTDRGSHYFVTPKAGQAVAKEHLTQVGRALQQLGIEPIPSYSPEARGRMERAFGTLQQRLPQELRPAGITTIEAANRIRADRFVPAHNRRFAVAAAEPGSAFVPFAGDRAEIPCLQRERVVDKDNCVRCAGVSLQIRHQRHRHRFVRVRVRVHADEDGRLARLPRPASLGTLHAGRGQDSRLSSLGGAPRGFMDDAPRRPQLHRANSSSRHLICDEKRTSFRAIDTPLPAFKARRAPPADLESAVRRTGAPEIAARLRTAARRGTARSSLGRPRPGRG